MAKKPTGKGCACKKWICPSTRYGRLSLGLFGIFAAFFLVAQIIVAYGAEGGETLMDSLDIAIPMILAFVSSIAAFVAGLMAILKQRERAIPIYGIVLIGFFLIVLLVAEFTVME